ncbi:MAG: gamma-glutamylcyclotransferase family protein [Geminicoccaceae bacterium]
MPALCELVVMGRLRRIVKSLLINALVRCWPLCRLWYRRAGIELDGHPDDDVWYFAYGANMHDSAFRKRRRMKPRQVRAGRIKGYRLRFNLDGRPKGKAAPANIMAEPSTEVWGVLYLLKRRNLIRLDASEGVPGRRYRHLWISAEDQEGGRLEVVTYLADGNEKDGKPSLRYITLLREGARQHGLPDAWLTVLDNVEPATSPRTD